MPLQALGSHSPWDSFAECCRGMPRGSSNVTDNPEPLQVKPGYLRGGGHAFTRLTAAARLLGQQRQRCVSSRSFAGEVNGVTEYGWGTEQATWVRSGAGPSLSKTSPLTREPEGTPRRKFLRLLTPHPHGPTKDRSAAHR